MDEVSDNSSISLDLGYGLISMVDSQDKKTSGPLISKITGIRRQVSKDLGFIIPNVRVRDDLSLDANSYQIKIGQTIVAEDKIYSDRKLAMPGDDTQLKIQGIQVKDPSFGLDAFWIEKHLVAKAESNHYMVIEPEAVIGTHLNQILLKYAGELLSQDDVQLLLDNLSKANPQLVQSVVPKLIPLHHLTLILRNLLVERVPISDLKNFRGLIKFIRKKLSPDELSEAVRPVISSLLIQKISNVKDHLNIVTFNPDFEQMLITMAKSSSEGLLIDPGLAKEMIKSLLEISEKFASDNHSLVIVTSPIIRKDLSILLRQHIEDVVVLSFTELPENKRVKVIATVGEKLSTSEKEKQMKTQTFKAKDVKSAINLVNDEFGDKAIILSTKKNNGFVEIEASDNENIIRNHQKKKDENNFSKTFLKHLDKKNSENKRDDNVSYFNQRDIKRPMNDGNKELFLKK